MVVKKYEGTVIIEIDEDKCDGNGACVEVCPTDVFDLVEGKSQANRIDDCIECCACVDACHVNAIKHTTC
ncbi:MAG: 4Fe-4S binding protein [Candidatus Methanoperedenaceae archaeon]|nr:4Fe-4S binding protein [Candidatus Methanoperedenaceae archaeon]MDW7728182.1 4Fe-4S binding protein [Candidatus Methanoperedens sp.]